MVMGTSPSVGPFAALSQTGSVSSFCTHLIFPLDRSLTLMVFYFSLDIVHSFLSLLACLWLWGDSGLRSSFLSILIIRDTVLSGISVSLCGHLGREVSHPMSQVKEPGIATLS